MIKLICSLLAIVIIGTPNLEIREDIPLSGEVQLHAVEQAELREVPVELVYAIMNVESSFRVDVISTTNDWGLMQINEVNHEWLRDLLDIEDYLDPFDNIIAGTFMIGWLYNKYECEHLALMAYNHGEGRASYYWDKGVVESNYSRKVVNLYETYRETEGDS